MRVRPRNALTRGKGMPYHVGMANHRFHNPAVTAAIDAAGGVAEVARRFGVTYQSVREWHLGMRRLPGPRCHALAAMAGVKAETLRPDLIGYWQQVREAA